MAICFVRPRYVTRSKGGSACNSSAYNARGEIVDERTGEVFNWTKRGGNVFHEVSLPEHVDKKFKNISVLANEVESNENRKDSQLFVEWVLALPKEKEVTLEMKKEILRRFIKHKGWIQEGLSVQIDMHSPHDKNDNWHAHLLTSTRRFTKDGKGFERLKARDLQPKIAGGKVVEEMYDSIAYTQIQNDIFKENGLDLRVDLPNKIAQEHIGPVRMRNVMNEAVYRNEERVAANIKYLNSGKRVLKSITEHMSVFSKSDLERVVKIVPDAVLRGRLVEEALSSESLIMLHDENGKATGSYTTNEVRSEEAKLLRLGGYINSSKNLLATGNEKSRGIVAEMVESARGSLTEEQHSALSHLLLGEGGVRILRGRAGTGKSYVLGKVASIAKASGLNVIGLAPTHKARSELASRGYEQNDTIKGMLFKLNNGRFELPKGSLLVVDEAGMVGNDDFKELLRVAAGLKCNMIKSGDERQIASVQRGGMFEVFAEKYGSASILNIQRQKNAWGRSVAMALSKGEVRSGVSILEANGKILEAPTKNESMQSLLADWSKSKEKIADRVILAVKNADVTALNHGARQYLKLSGDLRGNEVSVAGHYYMKGDRVLIKETNKKLGLVNGDFATVMHASRDRFVLGMESVDSADTSNDNKKLVEFNPSAYSGFRHGYATTIFKAQAASILEVFVFHDGFAGIRNSYVALSRNVENLRLYINNEATKSINHLIKQLGHDSEIGSSLSYFTKQELADKALDAEFEKGKGLVGSMIMNAFDFTVNKITAFNDKHFIDNAYYKYVAPKFQKQSVEEVLEKVGEEMEQEAIGSSVMLEQKAVVGGSPILNHTSAISNEVIANNKISITPKAKQSAKERFYKRADYVRAASSQENRAQQKAQWDIEAERLRNEVKFKAEIIARNLLGDPNKNLSDGKTLRFGEHGKVAVRISGDRVGNWFDFSADKGGDMFALVQDRQGCDFKGAAEYLRKSVGMEASNNSHLKLVNIHRTKDLTEKHIQAKAEEERVAKSKAEHVEKLYARAKDIGDRSVAYRYLTQHRKISTKIEKDSDIKSGGIYIRNEINNSEAEITKAEKGKYLPAIIAFARNAEGLVTGGQQIILNPTSATKADIAIPKKSFGKIAGSFVEVGNDKVTQGQEKVTIIAEGLETAFSIKQALHNQNTKILCSLGISNIKNYPVSAGEKIIIAADNDGVDSNTSRTIENAKSALEEKGAFLEVVKPLKEGDFNDILRSEGADAIRADFKAALSKHKAATLDEYLAVNSTVKLDDLDKENLAHIQRYKMPEKGIIDSYRKGEIHGKIALDTTRKKLELVGQDLGFLIKNKVNPTEKLFETLQNTKDLPAMAEEFKKKCQEHAKFSIDKDLLRGEFLASFDREKDLTQLIEQNQTNHRDMLNYIEPGYTTDRLNALHQRVEIYKIVEKEQKQNPIEAKRFKEEALSNSRFAKSEIKNTLQCYQKKGLVAATDFAQKKNGDSVIEKLALRRANIIKSDEFLAGKDYISCAAQDNEIMRYVDKALLDGRSFDNPQPKDNNLLDYANQRDINNISKELEGRRAEVQFKESARDLQQFATNMQVKQALELYKDKNIDEFTKYAEKTCKTIVIQEVQQNIENIERGKKVESLDGTKYKDRGDYLAATGANTQIMKYIEPDSTLARQIEKQQQMEQEEQRQETKSWDFER